VKEEKSQKPRKTSELEKFEQAMTIKKKPIQTAEIEKIFNSVILLEGGKVQV